MQLKIILEERITKQIQDLKVYHYQLDAPRVRVGFLLATLIGEVNACAEADSEATKIAIISALNKMKQLEPSEEISTTVNINMTAEAQLRQLSALYSMPRSKILRAVIFMAHEQMEQEKTQDAESGAFDNLTNAELVGVLADIIITAKDEDEDFIRAIKSLLTDRASIND